jgi:hypothetical protein
MNKSLLEATVSTLEDTQSIRNDISGINAEGLPESVKALLRSVIKYCSTIDSTLEEALVRSCNASARTLPAREHDHDGEDLVLSGISR